MSKLKYFILFFICISTSSYSTNYYNEFKRGGYLSVLDDVKHNKVDINSVEIGEVKFISHYFIYSKNIDARILALYSELGGHYNNSDKYLIPLCQTARIDKLNYLSRHGYELKNEYERKTCIQYAVNFSSIELTKALSMFQGGSDFYFDIINLIENKEKHLNSLSKIIKEM